MLKAVLKKSREGGKGSKKETGMCTITNWADGARSGVAGGEGGGGGH